MKRVGRYEIQARIGQGAMAEVYRAYDPKIGRVLAIKVLKPEYCRIPEYADRFIREARAAGALSHPNIVTIYDVGDVAGYPYIAMELLAGEPLDNVLLARGQFSISTVIGIGLQLADALNYAHGMGIIHRDIKPSNIMLGQDGHSIKILDFGIARVAEADPANLEAGQMTQVGQVVGTPRYMSPEQALSRELDGRSDLFSVGAVLYELLTGHPAFNGTTLATLALQITQQDPAPINIAPQCPRGLEFIVKKLLEKKPERRFTTGATLLEALTRERDSYGVALAEGRRRRIPLQLRLTLLACGVTVLVLLAALSVVVSRQNATMEQLAITSGSSIASFVATNAALHAADNASLPEADQDWLPVQAFVNSASADANVTDMMIVDGRGIVRAASDPAQVGSVDDSQGGEQAPTVATGKGEDNANVFRFSQPITYAGRKFGYVKLGMHKAPLESAAAQMRNMLIGLAVLVVAMVGCLSYAAARALILPLRRLKAALRDAAAGDVDFLISHQRADEFGELFDSFNAFASSVQRLEEGPQRSGPGPAETVVFDASAALPPQGGSPLKFARTSR